MIREIAQWLCQHKHPPHRPSRFRSRSSAGPPPWALQDPRASLRRQLRSAQGWLPAGWFLAAVYWDIESGGIDLEHRSQGDAHQAFAGPDLPRDGGMADLLREASSPAPRFAAVVCEDIERSGRDMFNALKLEKNCPGRASRYSPPTSPPTSKASTPPPYSSAG
jgi:hypothetical protein